MFPRASRLGVVTLLGGVLILFVSVIAQLATDDGLLQTIWVAVSIIGAVVIVVGITVLIRHAGRNAPPED